MATNVYIDGFNFYNRIYRYGRNKNVAQQYKWLDLRKMGKLLAGSGDVDRVSLFTAKVSPMGKDLNMPQRQQLWWNALETVDVQIIEGEFKQRPKRYPLQHQTGFADVMVYEEKATDVNLASHLLRDAFLKRCDEAIVVSNDSDLQQAISIAVNDAGIRVVVVSPDTYVHRSLQSAVRDSQRDTDVIRMSLLKASQLPSPIELKSGSWVSKPSSW